MSSTSHIAYLGTLESVSFREDDTLIGVSINQNIPVRAGRVLIIELTNEAEDRRKLIRAIGKALERESEAAMSCDWDHVDGADNL